MFLPSLALNSIPTFPAVAFPRRCFPRLAASAHIRPSHLGTRGGPPTSSAAVLDSLRLLEWDKVCDAVSSFAGTALGRQASKEQLWSVDASYEESKKLLDETAAAVELINYGAGAMDFAGVDTVLVKSAISHASRGFPLSGAEALAVVSLIQFAESLQITLETAIKEDSTWYNRLMPLRQVILEVNISRSFVKSVQRVIDEDGSVKDSASSELKRSRDQVRVLERKLYQLMDKIIRSEKNEASSLEMCIVNGRCCIKVMADHSTTVDGLLLSSCSGVGSIVEPIAVISLNDELQQARVLLAKAEEDVLSRLTDKMLAELEGIQNLLGSIIWLDVVAVRAKYSISYGGTYPDFYLPSDKGGVPMTESNFSSNETVSSASFPRKEWKLYMPKASHPLLLWQHREKLHEARKDVANTIAEIRRRKFQRKITEVEDDLDSHLASMKRRVAELEKEHPIPVDFMVSAKTCVLVITGPNTGGKTISLKTVGLASLMAKTGLFVLASEPVKIPWFDAVFADIGDEQSLTQSLSTFSGHLRQISVIRSQSTSQSLILLDEVGAGTNPLEGAALGMSLLESFAEAGSFLTIATTHHGELKTLKYSNDAFDNACVEFDEDSLKPTYNILWGVPGRSNAINIAARLGLPNNILDSARKLYGTASAEINEVIVDMERFKQHFQQHLQEAQYYVMLSRKLHERLLMAKQKIAAHGVIQRERKVKAISETAALARSVLRTKLKQFRESALTERKSQYVIADSSTKLKQFHESALTERKSQNAIADSSGHNHENPKQMPSEQIRSSKNSEPATDKQTKDPEVGDMVYVPSLGKQAMVLKVQSSQGEILVQASNIKLRLKLKEIEAYQERTS